MAISLPLILGGAGILSGLLKSQQYYPAAEAPSRAQIYGDAIGGGIGGYLGGSQLGGGDPLGILGGLGLGNRPQDIRAEDVLLPEYGVGVSRTEHTPIENFGRAEKSDDERLLEILTGGGGILNLNQFTQPRNQEFGSLLGGILGGFG